MGIKNPGLRGCREDSFVVRVRHSWPKMTPLVAVRALQQPKFLEWFCVRSSQDWTCHLGPGIKSVRASHILTLPLQMLAHTLVKSCSSLPPSRYQTVLTFKTQPHTGGPGDKSQFILSWGECVGRPPYQGDQYLEIWRQEWSRVKSSAQHLAGPGVEFQLFHCSASHLGRSLHLSQTQFLHPWNLV